jgi:antitoxin component YwqK of YwqJK toxin-antitoxin module
MKKVFLLFAGFFCLINLLAQPSGKILFVIDSIPQLTDPEPWNQVVQDDISDISIIKDKDSLRLLGWQELDAITYIFTKEYRNRPDSLKKIPSLKHMVMKNGAWYLHDVIYSGKYIDYYNNGRMQNEGVLLDGKLNGQLIVYFRNGNKKSVTDYKHGTIHGAWMDYYKNGMLMQEREYREGKMNTSTTYFINGQTWREQRPKKRTAYDTSVLYFSNGKINSISFRKPGDYTRTRRDESIGYYTGMYYQSLSSGDFKAANKNFYQLWLLDSTNIETYFKEGYLLVRESRFDDAIEEFDKAIAKEPLMREALTFRALARILKYKFSHAKIYPNDSRYIPLGVEDMTTIPDEELLKICQDIQLADDIDQSDLYVMSVVPLAIINFCRNRK